MSSVTEAKQLNMNRMSYIAILCVQFGFKLRKRWSIWMDRRNVKITIRFLYHNDNPMNIA